MNNKDILKNINPWQNKPGVFFWHSKWHTT